MHNRNLYVPNGAPQAQPLWTAAVQTDEGIRVTPVVVVAMFSDSALLQMQAMIESVVERALAKRELPAEQNPNAAGGHDH